MNEHLLLNNNGSSGSFCEGLRLRLVREGTCKRFSNGDSNKVGRTHYNARNSGPFS